MCGCTLSLGTDDQKEIVRTPGESVTLAVLWLYPFSCFSRIGWPSRITRPEAVSDEHSKRGVQAADTDGKQICGTMLATCFVDNWTCIYHQLYRWTLESLDRKGELGLIPLPRARGVDK
ncbi:hypothetical protein BC835DRAFT_478096 [Cytidiella melzeri]|nr:hypothetical protein BC835DRAFT_487121 [Cytidiella melzeri]KAI0700060.1 hypothetical protein BC835DRAFT_478096 [Cytidiella melzeri]